MNSWNQLSPSRMNPVTQPAKPSTIALATTA